MPFNIWDILILVSLAQGMLFGIVLLSVPQFKKSPAKYLAFSIIMLSIIGMNQWLSSWNFDDQYYLIDLLGDDVPWILLFYVPMFVYFLKASGHPLQNSPKLFFLLSPFIVFLGLNLLIDGDVDFNSLNHLFNPSVRAGYTWNFKDGRAIGAHYHAAWTSYALPRPLRMFESGLDITYFF